MCWLLKRHFSLKEVLKIDDPVGAVAVHGVNGAWGCIALGLFADGTYGDGLNGVAGTVTGSLLWQPWSAYLPSSSELQPISSISEHWIGAVFKLIDVVIGNRVKPEDELDGLDIPEMGVEGYCGIRLDKNSETPLSK